MLSAREAFISLENDRVLRKALEQRIYSDHTDIKPNDWIYYKTNANKYWKGPVKVTSKEGKRLYILSAGQLYTINTDDVLLTKSDQDMFSEIDAEELVSAPKPSTADEANSSKDISISEQSKSISQTNHNVSENVLNDHHTDLVNSDNLITSDYLGTPSECNVCKVIMSSKIMTEHVKNCHGIVGTLRQVSKQIPPHPESIYLHPSYIRKDIIKNTFT